MPGMGANKADQSVRLNKLSGCYACTVISMAALTPEIDDRLVGSESRALEMRQRSAGRRPFTLKSVAHAAAAQPAENSVVPMVPYVCWVSASTQVSEHRFLGLTVNDEAGSDMQFLKSYCKKNLPFLSKLKSITDTT